MRRFLCFSAGFWLALSALLGAVLLPATSAPLFEQALLANVDADALGLSEASLTGFARETMRYLRLEKATWEPSVGFPIPDAFCRHMAEVRGWVALAPWVLLAGLIMSLGLLWLGGRQRVPCLRGLLGAVALVACVLLWAVADFDSLWMALHRLFIPGGIFPAGEPIMRLFPLSLFFHYIVPVGLSALGHLAAACGLVFGITRKGRTAS